LISTTYNERILPGKRFTARRREKKEQGKRNQEIPFCPLLADRWMYKLKFSTIEEKEDHNDRIWAEEGRESRARRTKTLDKDTRKVSDRGGARRSATMRETGYRSSSGREGGHRFKSHEKIGEQASQMGYSHEDRGNGNVKGNDSRKPRERYRENVDLK